MAALNKIYIVSALCAALCTGSCIRDNGEMCPDGAANQICFGVSQLGSRGEAIMDEANMTSMGIFGYSTGTGTFNPADPSQTPNLFHNRLAERQSDGSWVYDPVAYWPMDISINNSFFAYAPHSSEFAQESNAVVSNPTASGYPTLTYTLPPDILDVKDILYSTPVLNRNRNSVNTNSKTGTVLYNMKHATAWLAFVVAPSQYESPDESYTVTWLAFMATRMAITSTLNLGTGAWGTPVYGEVRYEFGLNGSAVDISPGTGARVVSDDSYLMLLPFNIDSSDKASVDITFTYNPPGVTDPEVTQDEFYYTLPVPTTTMVAGRVVVYVINISKEGASLSFGQDNWIEDWLPGDDTNTEIF